MDGNWEKLNYTVVAFMDLEVKITEIIGLERYVKGVFY